MIAPKDFLVFVVNVGDDSYSHYTLPFFRSYCNRHDYQLFILKQPINERIHPSWYKLMSHSLCDAKYILCVDLDIFIMPDSPPVHLDIEDDKIAMAYDPGRNGGMCNWYDRPTYFQYNCGLIGIPKSMQEFMERIYRRAAPSGGQHPWEQMHVNEAIARNETPITLLDEKWNMLLGCSEASQRVVNTDWHFKHMTHCGKYDFSMRYVWLKQHYDYYSRVALL